MRTSRLFTLWMLVIYLPAFAQNAAVVDSLLKVLDNPRSENEKGQTYYQLASEVVETKPEDAEEYAGKGLKIARKQNDTTLIIRCEIQLGIANDNLGNMAEAFGFHNDALSLAQKTHNEFLQAACYINIGMVYSHTNGDSASREKSLDSYHKALELQLKRNDKPELSNTYMNIGTAFFDMSEYDSALVYYQRSLSLAEEARDLQQVAYCNNNMGTAYYKQKNYPLAVQYFEKAKKIKVQLNDRRGMASSYANLGELYGAMGRFDDALLNLDSGLIMAKNIRNKEYVEMIYETQANVYTDMKDYQSALDSYKMYIVYKDSIFDSQKSKDMLDIQNKYETTQKQRENDLLKKTTAIQQESIQRKDLLNYVISSGLLLVLIGAFFIFRAYSQKKKANQEISVQKIALEQKNKDIMDSISYARKIQRALLPNEKQVDRNMNRLKRE